MHDILFELRQKNDEVTGIKLVIGYLGVIMIITGIIVLSPLLMLAAFPEEYIYAKGFLISGALAVGLGSAMSLCILKKNKGRLQIHQDAVIVALAWFVAVFFSALPYMIDGELSFSGAIFEAASMWTTSGMSVSDTTILPKLFLFSRSEMQFFGGVGLILVALSFFSDARLGKVFNAEGHADKLLPNLKKTARAIFIIYLCYALLGAILYMLCGMSWFEAINYSLSSLSTGGGACTAGGIAGYNSLPIEIITILLMLLGGTSFMVHLYLLRRKFKSVAGSSEVRFFFGYVLFMVLLCTAITGNFRISLFQTVSAVTGTGFQTIDTFVGIMPAFFFLLILMMLIGGQNGSTSGGLKTHRVYILLKDIWWSLRGKLGSPRVIRVNKWNRLSGSEVLTPSEKSDCYNFIILFILVFLVATFIVSATGYGLEDAAFYIASCIGNVGLTAGVVPATASAGVLWTGTITMLLGRLEIYIVLFAIFRIGKSTAGIFQKK